MCLHSVRSLRLFFIEVVFETPTAVFGGYYLEFNSCCNADHTHVVDKDWLNMYAELRFNKELQLSGVTVHGGVASVSGSVLTIELASIEPAYEGDFSMHGTRIVGSGDFKCESIETKHH